METRNRNRNKTNNTLTNHNTTIGDTNMRTHKLFSRFGLAMVAILLLSSMQHVYAAGTLAGTTITNVASVQYNAGVNVRNGTSNIITMVVGYKVVINLSTSNSSTTTVDSTSIYKAYTVTNTGNYADSLQFTVTHLPAGWIDTVFYDKDASGTETPGDSVLTSGGAGFWTAISGSHAILLKITLPGYAQAQDNMIDSVTVTTASYGTGPSAVVRVGGNGLQKYTANVTIAQPVLTVTGAQTVTGSPAIPGSAFAYTLTLQNTGHLAIQDGATLSFKLDSNFNFTSATNSGSNGSVNWAGDGGTVTWTLSHTDLPATMGSPITRTVNVTIQQVTKNGTGAAAGSLISIMDSTKSTTTNLVFNDGVNTHTIATAKLTQVTVAQASGAYVTQLTANQSKNPGDSTVYQIRVKNRGNSAMTFTLSQARSGGNLDTTHLFTATSGVAGSQPFTTASINAGDSLGLYVYLIVNVTGQNGNTIIRVITAAPGTAGTQPLGAGNYNPTDTITTTVTAPNLNIVLSQAWISGVGNISNPAPGDVIEYTLTITNNGTGTATNLSTTNVIPTNTTFLPNAYAAGKGIMIGGVAQTNVVDGDNGSFVGSTVSASSLTVNGGGASVAIKYQVSVN
jgi:uncharacterized repeat protein (TIGR01451 family)